MSGQGNTPAPDLKGFLNKHADAIREVAAATITPDRMVRLVCAAASREPRLAQCSPMSILRSMMQAAELGLEVCSGLQEGHLIPRWNKKGNGGLGCLEATFLPGYQGLIRLACESGSVRNIEARIVYENDFFEHEEGTQPRITHRPTLKERGEIVAVYGVAFFPDGGTQFEVMPRADVDAIMKRSKDKDDGFSPWKSDYGEMARKTAVRRLSKYLRKKSQAFAKALEIQAKAEAGDYLEGEVVRPGDANPPELAAKIVNEDGDAEWNWTDEEREGCKIEVSTYVDQMLEKGIIEPDAIAIADEYTAKIGTPDISPEKWSNRLSGAYDRAIAKVAKAS